MKKFFYKLFEGEEKILAEAEIVAQGGQAYCNLKAPNNVNLIILLTTYFTKIRWYMETEPPMQLERMKRMYIEALNRLPEVEDYNISSCAANEGSMVFRAQLIRQLRTNNIGLINEMPNALGDRDSPDSCFVLFKAVWERLNEKERQDMADSLQQLKPVIMADKMDRTGKALAHAYVTSNVIADLLTQGQWEYLEQ
ncbi:MAG TPA: hypothetical protein P5309_09265 [Syntrophomonadaceae bacterium]|nr:hypothetical protein [Syntrophomonadaceae bacterium]